MTGVEVKGRPLMKKNDEECCNANGTLYSVNVGMIFKNWKFYLNFPLVSLLNVGMESATGKYLFKRFNITYMCIINWGKIAETFRSDT